MPARPGRARAIRALVSIAVPLVFRTTEEGRGRGGAKLGSVKVTEEGHRGAETLHPPFSPTHAFHAQAHGQARPRRVGRERGRKLPSAKSPQ